ncbi:unnamed protein product [Rotaria magnacalcarata]|uniref:Flavin-containing monooxygenase n=1 Tax=Rotaria magnacalcarata TaxID=392030 RepID=A0A819T818_9BILA|nr:unnamed protein product [Rotaria magnacalcarata]CAF4074489.1 unnamed protein product [Rotaria magnacalcarata]
MVDYSFDHHFGHSTPSYLPRALLYDYIVGRAITDDIRHYIRFLTAVRWISFDEQSNTFRVTVEDLRNSKTEYFEFDNVVVASGHFSVPNIPLFDGIINFPGRVMHAHDFRDASDFSGKRLLLIGAGPSAEDIGIQCYKFGARSITISYRSAALGYKWPKGICEVPLLQRVNGQTAHFRDGSSVEIDAIIFCTGYRHNHSFMAEPLRLRCSRNSLYPERLYKGVFWLDNPRLAYLGMQDQNYTLNMFDVQGALVRDFIFGQDRLRPSSDTIGRQRDVDIWLHREAVLPVSPTPGYIEVGIDFQADYIKDLLAHCNESNAPTFDVDAIAEIFKQFLRDKKNSFLTYRDQIFVSTITGKWSLAPSVPWMKVMDDSIEV